MLAKAARRLATLASDLPAEGPIFSKCLGTAYRLGVPELQEKLDRFQLKEMH